MSATFVYDCWYVVAMSDDVGMSPVRSPLMDDAVVLYRTDAGEIIALRDRCAHCGIPLSMGTTDDGNIVCAYHGLVYDQDGVCIAVPSQPNVPAGTRVPPFPVHDDGTFIWVWPGNPGAASLNSPPRLSEQADETWASFSGNATIEADYVLLHQHLLDITHFWIGMPDESPSALDRIPALNEVEVTETSVSYTRTHPPAALVDWEAKATGLDRSKTYAHQDGGSFISPGLHKSAWNIHAGDTVYIHLILRAFTPLANNRTRVFTVCAFNYGDKRPSAVHVLRAVLKAGDAHEVELVEAVQANLGSRRSDRGLTRYGGEVGLRADAAGLRATAIIREMILKETGRLPRLG